jgi:putative flippase GtrA
MNSFKKTDFILALVLGEVCAWLMFLIGKNLALENMAMAGALPYFKYLPIVFPILCALGLVVAYFISKVIPVIYQLGKFILVGGTNFLIDMGILNFLIFYTGISAGLAQSGFKGISFLVATWNSYFLNKYWTFKRETNEGAMKEFFQFLIVSVIGFAINLGVDYVAVNMMSPLGGMLPKTWAQVSAVIASVTALGWNFLGYKFLVFESKSKTDFD